MARPKLIKIHPTDPNVGGYAVAVTGDLFELTANDAGDNLAHKVSISNNDPANHSDKILTLIGIDADGVAIAETLDGPAQNATVVSVGYFKTLTEVTISATIDDDTFDIGWEDEVVTQTVPLNFYAATSATLSVSVTGTIDFTMQETFTDVMALVSPVSNAVWTDIDVLKGKTATTVGHALLHATAVRLVVASYQTKGASPTSMDATLDLNIISDLTSR